MIKDYIDLILYYFFQKNTEFNIKKYYIFIYLHTACLKYKTKATNSYLGLWLA